MKRESTERIKILLGEQAEVAVGKNLDPTGCRTRRQAN